MSSRVHDIIEKLRMVFDPEIPVSIVDLGLIYDVAETGPHTIKICMTVTSPFCPAAAFLPQRVKEEAEEVAGIGNVEIELVMIPAWSRDRMSKEAKAALGYT